MRAALLTFVVTLLGAVVAHAQGTASSAPLEPAGSVPSADGVPRNAAVPAAVEMPAAAVADVSTPMPIEAPGEPKATPTPPGASPPSLTEAELRELGFSATEPGVDTSLQLSGFIDFGTQQGLGESRGIAGKQAFYIGNVNLYISKNLTESLRTMAEVRFLYLPNGAAQTVGDPTVVNTSSADYADFNRSLHWGGVELERVYIEWALHRFLTVRAGQYLTPYGVWNVDHGSPTVITVQRPFVVGYSFFPERQTGLELYGRWEASNASTLGYHLTLSNGTGPASEYKDLDNNKAVGGRLYWESRALGELKFGGSAYYGRNTEAKTSGSFVNQKLKLIDTVTSQADTLALALDATFKYRGIHVQAEFITRQLKFTPEGRTPSFSISTMSSNYPADGFRYGGYLLLGYRFDWFGVMPYVVIQRVGGVASLEQAKDQGTPVLVGLNIRPIDALAVKVEYAHVFFDKGSLFPGYDIQLVSAQVAWAF